MELQTAPERNGTGPDHESRTGTEAPDHLTAAQAASFLGVTDRTLRKYARAGRLDREFGPEGHPRYRRDQVEALQRQLLTGDLDSGPERLRVRTGSGTSPDRRGMGPDRPWTEPERPRSGPDSPDSGPLNGHRHTMSPDAATVERQAEEIAFLRAQLERRAEESQRQAEAERELRVMLMQLERTNAELAASLCAKALPPAPEPEPDPPKRVRWWARIWGSG